MSVLHGDLLILLLDVPLLLSNPPAQQGYEGHNASTSGAGSATGSLLEQVLYFVAVYLMVSQSNMLAVFGLMHNVCEVLYLSDGLGPEGVGAVAAGSPTQCIHAALTSMLLRHPRPTLATQSQHGSQSDHQGCHSLALSAGLSRALCLIHRLQASGEESGAGVPVAPPSTVGHSTDDPTAHAHAYAAPPRLRPRILCVTSAPDARPQYVATMNAIFSAQRADVTIDTLMLGPTNSTYLQQAAHLTGGLYLQVSPTAGTIKSDRATTTTTSAASALQHLLSAHALDRSTRALLTIQQPLGVDFRASCFCHKRPVDVGHVCSVCLSIFCEPRTECLTCGSQFGGGG